MSRRMLAWWTCLGIVLAGYGPTGRADTTAEEVEENNSLVSRFVTRKQSNWIPAGRILGNLSDHDDRGIRSRS